MSGETALKRLISSMEPRLHDEEFVYCAVPFAQRPALELPAICEFREAEGITLIVRRKDAEIAGLDYQYPCRMITLNIHSSLAAVGFLAAVCSKLAGNGISVNPVSAFHHDHLFVPSARAEEALRLLEDLSANGE